MSPNSFFSITVASEGLSSIIAGKSFIRNVNDVPLKQAFVPLLKNFPAVEFDWQVAILTLSVKTLPEISLLISVSLAFCWLAAAFKASSDSLTLKLPWVYW